MTPPVLAPSRRVTRWKLHPLEFALLLLWPVILCCGIGIRWATDSQPHYSLTAGMTREEILQRVGEPKFVLQTGETISRFGGSEETVATRETWIYHPQPQSIRRVLVEFADDRAVEIKRQVN